MENIEESLLANLSSKLGEVDPLKPIKVPQEFLEKIGLEKHFISILFIYLCFAGKDQNNWEPLEIVVKSKLPVGAGLGSSASYNTSVVLGMMKKFRIAENMEENEKKTLLNEWSFSLECLMHGTPSGIDNSIVVNGGAITCENRVINPINAFPQLKFLITNTTVPRSTAKLVGGVRERRNLFPKLMDPLFDVMGSVSTTALESFSSYHKQIENLNSIDQNENNRSKVEDELQHQVENLIDINQGLLNSIGVGHPVLDKLVNLTKKYQLHSKLTGKRFNSISKCLFI